MTEKKKLILVVNDDGYEARGLEAMVEVAKSFGEVVVVTPDRAQSGKAHAVTMNEPLRLNLYKTVDGIPYWRTNGTPTDCMKLGQKVVLKDRPIDLVLSGINHGSNSSVSLIYSGTMAAAVEASFESIPAVGLSLLDYSPNADFTAAVHFGKIIVKQVLEKGLPPTSASTSISRSCPLRRFVASRLPARRRVSGTRNWWSAPTPTAASTIGWPAIWKISMTARIPASGPSSTAMSPCSPCNPI